ncbi:MAG TPA: hypothetical protein VFA58_09485 [Chthoniobacterales bacterium]|nr:hypothetical protein [Chthoniobacterales bacterium]
MNPTQLTTIVTLIAALSVASERLVEIVKGALPWPWLKVPNPNPTQEGYRQALLQLLAVVAGILTAWLASAAIPTDVGIPNDVMGKLALGLLASGGSGFWNSVLTYVKSAKDIKASDAETKKLNLQLMRANVQKVGP